MIIQYDKVNVISASLLYSLKQKPHDNPEEPYKLECDVSCIYTVEEQEDAKN